ncbi:hypothetical protein K439DRAFT_1611898 [Ramaria rubella]|nr:hypothetical protein K439DRAFT_1611898 [Ramaria rubella]
MDTPSPSSSSSRYMDRSRLVACRECRRSKIRCSRTFPCDACTRRGCTDICPDGIKETKRSKSDENLLQENARLVRRIRHLESALSSMEHPAALLPSPGSDDPVSPLQQSSQPYDTSSSSESSDGNDEVIPTDQDDRQAEASLAKMSHLRPLPQESDLSRHLLGMIEPDLTNNMAALAPGCRFTLRALLELCRACGIIDSNGQLPITQPVRPQPQYFPSSSSTSSSPISASPVSRTPWSDSDSDVFPPFPNSEQDMWGMPDMFPSPESGDHDYFGTLVPEHTDGQHIRPDQLNLEKNTEPMSLEQCQQLLVDLGIVSEGQGVPYM